MTCVCRIPAHIQAICADIARVSRAVSRQRISKARDSPAFVRFHTFLSVDCAAAHTLCFCADIVVFNPIYGLKYANACFSVSARSAAAHAGIDALMMQAATDVPQPPQDSCGRRQGQFRSPVTDYCS